MPGEGLATGSIARAARVLDSLARRPDGASLAEVVADTAFTRSTAHRVLSALAGVDYAFQDPETRAWRLSARLAALSRLAGFVDVAASARRGMKRLAEATGDTVFLSVREGAAAVCIAREVGAYPIRTLTLDRGDRRPLGVGAGSLALYAALPARTRAAVNRINAAWLAEYGFDARRLEAEVAACAARGYALNAGGIVPAMSAVAVPVITRAGRVGAALAIGAINERMGEARIQAEILPALRREAAHLAERLSVREEEAA